MVHGGRLAADRARRMVALSLEGGGVVVHHLGIITRAVVSFPGLGTVLGGCLSGEFGGSPRYRIW
ncbi:hypothetical protein T484DRAFT_1929328 [Baffinella frigidus]|nr:hypothetical protein T484DRAFT_1929328 [Cryptophyta sp. CCMP2293]